MPTRRFPSVPIVALILQIAAVLMVIGVIVQTWNEFSTVFQSWHGPSQSMYGMPSPAVKDFAARLKSLIPPIMGIGQGFFLAALAWGFGCLIKALREIEFNTRKDELAALAAPKAE